MTVARGCGCEVAHLPGLSMRRLADVHPGSGKTDARDAYVIADAARTMSHLLHSIDVEDSVRADPAMVLGYDDDLAQDATRTSNRLRGVLTSVHPALERVLGPACGTRPAWPCCRPSVPRPSWPGPAPSSWCR